MMRMTLGGFATNVVNRQKKTSQAGVKRMAYFLGQQSEMPSPDWRAAARHPQTCSPSSLQTAGCFRALALNSSTEKSATMKSP